MHIYRYLYTWSSQKAYQLILHYIDTLILKTNFVVQYKDCNNIVK